MSTTQIRGPGAQPIGPARAQVTQTASVRAGNEVASGSKGSQGRTATNSIQAEAQHREYSSAYAHASSAAPTTMLDASYSGRTDVLEPHLQSVHAATAGAVGRNTVQSSATNSGSSSVPTYKPFVSDAELKYISRILGSLPSLTFPIHSAGSLAAQLRSVDLGKALNMKMDKKTAIASVPAYYFPITSGENFIEKVAQLMRGSK